MHWLYVSASLYIYLPTYSPTYLQSYFKKYQSQKSFPFQLPYYYLGTYIYIYKTNQSILLSFSHFSMFRSQLSPMNIYMCSYPRFQYRVINSIPHHQMLSLPKSDRQRPVPKAGDQALASNLDLPGKGGFKT
ncbi:hypothetical protein EYC80_001277 [Monilinia laxa]|uniref:Uncharacterized protein n=1 Tax=Monilinia laxa TaxID=61186 RepID=A0A5N6K8S7_MONLA|nr:hypothetical protein EYC80_001277 [Monilinia laxa]